MSAAPPPVSGKPACLLCHATFDRLAVTVEGDLLGCEHCAHLPAGAGVWRTAAEWEAHGAVRGALAVFGVQAQSLTQAPLSATLRPRAHVWFVTADGRRLMLKRHDNAPTEAAVRFEGELRQHLADAHLPVAPFMSVAGGATWWTDAHGSCWTIHEAPRGIPYEDDQMLWSQVGSIGGKLAQIHATLQPLARHGPPPTAWNGWSLETLRVRLAAWPRMAELTPELRDQALERVTSSKIFDTLPRLPQTIAHGNFGRTAIFMEGFSLAGVCEFERAHHAPAIFDFAFGLVSQFPPHVRAAVRAYERVRQLEPAERDALPEVLLLGTLIRVDRQLTIWHNQGKANGYAKAIADLLTKAEGLRKAIQQ